jgi:hypothetical protein
MVISNKRAEKVQAPTGEPGTSESARSTACEQQLGKDTLAELPNPATIGGMAAQLVTPSASQISNELSRLHEACWTVLREPLHAAMTFRLALCAMETVCHLEGANGAYLLALSIAQYRVGQYQAAQSILRQVDEIIPGTPASLAFQAMAYYQLGAIAQARTLLLGLQQVLRQPPWHMDVEAAGFLREARKLIAKS